MTQTAPSSAPAAKPDGAGAPPAAEASPETARAHGPAGLWTLVLGSVGVVYGDIGTSPLYAFREALVSARADGILLREENAGLPFPLILTGPTASAPYFEQIDRFIRLTLGEEAASTRAPSASPPANWPAPSTTCWTWPRSTPARWSCRWATCASATC